MTKPLFGLFVKAIAGLLTVLALFYAIEDFRGARAWRAERERLEARGEELSFAKLTPVFAPPASLLGPVGLIDLIDWKNSDLLLVPALNPYFNGPKIDALGRIPIESWRRMLVDPKVPAPPGETPCEAGKRFLEAVAPLDATLAPLVSAAREGPIAYWDVRTGSPPESTRLPPLDQIRRLTLLLRHRIAAHFACGASARAIDEARVLTRLQESLSGLPFTITFFIEMVIAETLAETIQDGLARGALDARGRAMLGSLLKEDWLEGARGALRAERNWLIFQAESVRPGSDGSLTPIGLLLVPRGWILRQAVHSTRFTDDALALIADPARIDARAIDRLSQPPSDSSSLYNFIDGAAEPMVGRAVKWRLIRLALATETRVRLIRTAAAIAGFKDRTGSLPASLSDLTPTDLGGVPPTEILNGDLLRYRRSGEGYVLYSVGWNLKDDGARPGPFDFASQPDWVLNVGGR